MRYAPHPVTLRQLQYLVAVAERRSFRQAAELCNVSQPSLSAQVAHAEEVLGLRIFERDRRRVVPTAAGEAILEEARRVLASADALHGLSEQLGDPRRGVLRVGILPTVAPYLLPELAAVLRKDFPDLLVLWTEDKTSALVERLRGADLDGAILALEAPIGDLDRIVLGRDPFVLAAARSHPLARGRGTLSPERLAGQRVFLLDDGHCFREQALSFCAGSGAEEAGYRATSLATLVQMTVGGAGVTLLPRIAVPVENRRGDLRIRGFARDVPSRTLALVFPRRAAREPTLRLVGGALGRAYVALRFSEAS